VIWPAALRVVLTASGPPSEPMSRIIPLCQMNDRAWVPQPKSEYGSGMAIDPQAERCTAHGACSAVLLLVRW